MNEDLKFTNKFSWLLADGEIQTIDIDGQEYKYLAPAPVKDKGVAAINLEGMISELPIEFFSNQLLDLDTDNEKAVLEFASTYGIDSYKSECIPNIIKELLHDNEVNDQGIKLQNEYTELIDELERLHKHTLNIRKRIEGNATLLDKEVIDGIAYYDFFGEIFSDATIDSFDVVILREYQLWLRLLQIHVSNLMDTVKQAIENNISVPHSIFLHDGVSSFSIPLFNSLLSTKRYFGKIYDFDDSVTLSNAIANQMLETFSSDSEWLICKACGKPFKQKQPRYMSDKKTDKKPSHTPKFCSEKCADRYRVAKKRARDKERES